MRMRMCSLVDDANMLVPHADMLNHSPERERWFRHWRSRQRSSLTWEAIDFSSGRRLRMQMKVEDLSFGCGTVFEQKKSSNPEAMLNAVKAVIGGIEEVKLAILATVTRFGNWFH
ncbi:hypothetical protein Tsubulata_033054 [Turnera subulata]|uniref:SET domain-containing protein n=1 Tax=Turnera subulata TaxID=218843 RepID=A0A9Q0F0Y7_9ROSI|nr:hypothetical protein Tsubulata_033054 [Turnera subulata]